MTLQGKRSVGQDMSTAVSVRELFMPFPTPLNPQAPTDAQRQVVEKARGLTATLHDCDAMEATAKASNDANHPANPGELRLESVNPPALRQLLATMPLGKVSQPLIAADGVTMVMVCAREHKNMATLSRQDIANQIQGDRIELLSRQILRDLRRGANIDIRGGGA